MHSFNFTEREIRKIADSNEIVERGRRYYQNGNVGAISVSGGTITAKVKGHYGTYDVEIEIENNKVSDSFCDCPYDGDGCKHIVAVLYKFLNLKDKILGGQEQYRQRNKPQKDAMQWIKNIAISQVKETTSMNNMARALELADAKAVHLKFVDNRAISAVVHDAGERNVSVLPSDDYEDEPFEARCDCGKGYWAEKCEHIIAVIFAALKQAGKEEDVSKYELKLKNALKNKGSIRLQGILIICRRMKQWQAGSMHFILKPKKHTDLSLFPWKKR